MGVKRYRVVFSFDSFDSAESLEFSADFDRASSPIEIYDKDGTLLTSPYRVADARHSPRQAALLMLRWLGRE